MQTTQLAAAEQQNVRQFMRTAPGCFPESTSNPAPPAFAHQPVAPWVPKNAEHCNQRYFSRGDGCSSLIFEGVTLQALRWADKDEAIISLRVDVGGSCARVDAHCTAAELREIAARLLDAAHDLDTLPARVLMGGAA